MTAIWGPMGWMTLHSVATSYPEAPTETEKQLMSSWVEMFRDTITCPYCKQHFSEMLENYRRQFPGYLSSRHEFAMFSFRAHNAVNRRLKKPIYATILDCMQTLQNNIKTRSARDYRISYVNHITRYWRTFNDITGITAMRKIQEMKKIEEEYISRVDTKFDVSFRNDVVVLPADMLEKHVEPQTRSPVRFTGPGPVLKLGRGGFQIRR
jgi:hypothetical protein